MVLLSTKAHHVATVRHEATLFCGVAFANGEANPGI